MQPRIPKGAYCHSKCIGEKKYKPLQFETRKASDEKSSSDSSLTSLLTGVDLGQVDKNWFERKLQINDNGDCGVERGKKIPATPQHVTERTDQPSPSLFSPEDPSSSVPRNKRRKVGGLWNYSQATPICGLGVDMTPGMTPGIVAFTPNQATGRALDPSQQQSQASTTGFSPFPSWNPTNKLSTPAFMKQLFKTPSSIVKTPGRKMATPDDDRSTSQRLSISLGADLDDSNLSWTSSLATPPGSKSDSKMGNSDGIQSESEMRKGVMPKALHFSEDDIKPKTSAIKTGCDAHSQSLDNDTQPLQMLRLSSLEEEGTSEDTLDSDAIGGEKDDDGDVVMGIPRPNQQSAAKVKANNRPTTRSEKQSHLDTSLEAADKLEDHVAHLLGDAGEDNVVTDAKVIGDITAPPHEAKSTTGFGNGVKETKQVGIDDGLPKHKGNKLAEKIEASASESVNTSNNQSNIEETIAFFLATPPQRRLKLSKCSDASRKVSSKESERECKASLKSQIVEIKDRPKDISDGLGVEKSTQGVYDGPTTDVSVRETLARTKDDQLISIDESTKQGLNKNVAKNSLVDKQTTVGYPDMGSETAFIQKQRKQLVVGDKHLTPQKSDLSSINANLYEPHNCADVTPMSNTDQDLFSQISPNYADALCRALDAACDDRSMSAEKTSITSQKCEATTTAAHVIAVADLSTDQPNELVKHARSTFVLVKDDNNAHNKSQLSIQTDECQIQDTHTSESNQTTVASPAPIVPATKHGNTNKNVMDDEATAVFRMKPKAAKKFYYPSVTNSSPMQSSSTAKQLGSNSTTPKLMAGTLHVVEDEDSNVGSDTEVGKMNETSQASSTPATRSSGFVTFSSFMKSIDKDPKATSHTPESSGATNNASPFHQYRALPKTTPGAGNAKSLSVKANGNLSPAVASLSHIINPSTPVRGRSTSSLSLKSRRRLGRSSLPPPKRLKTTSEHEDFHQSVTLKGDPCLEKSTDDTKDTIYPQLERKVDSAANLSRVSEANQISVLDIEADQKQLSGCFTSGFKTAANNAINIAPKYLQKAKGMMAEIYSQEMNLQPGMVKSELSSGEPSVMSGFQTVSDKAIKVSSNSLQKAKGMMDEINNQEIKLETDTANIEVRSGGQLTVSSGFQTAANKTISVSSKSMQKAKGMMAEIYSQEVQLQQGAANDNASQHLDGAPVKSRFQPTANKAISVASNSLKNVKGMMAYGQDIQLIPCNAGNDRSANGASVLSGFQTAGNKAIGVSSRSLQKAKGMMADIYSQEIHLPLNDDNSGPSRCLDRAPVMLGFQTAANKAISVSSHSLQKAKGMMSEIYSQEVKLETDTATSDAISGGAPVKSGFQTAANKAISISSKSIQRARGMMSEIYSQEVQFSSSPCKTATDEGLERSLKTKTHATVSAGGLQPPGHSMSDKMENLQQVGILSASGKAIEISASSMKKAHRMMGEVESELGELNAESKPNLQKRDSGNVSSTSIDKDSLLMNEMATEISQVQGDSCVGFSSASGKVIPVSAGALQRAQSLIDGVDHELTAFPVNHQSIPSNVGFASASGKNITISDKAMQKAQSFMSSVNFDPDPIQAKDELKYRGENLITNQAPTKEPISPKKTMAFTGFKSASGRSIKISEEALKKAEMFVNDAQYTGEDVNSAAGHSSISENDSLGVRKESMPSFAMGFSSASGKLITVSDGALQKARSLLDEVNHAMNDSTPCVGQSTASSNWKSTTVSDGASDISHSFVSSGDSGINTSNNVINSSTEEIVNQSLGKTELSPANHSAIKVGQYRQLPQAQHGVKSKKDYSKLPKGFRPFKPPGKIDTSKKPVNQPIRQQFGNSGKSAALRNKLHTGAKTMSNFRNDSKFIHAIPQSNSNPITDLAEIEVIEKKSTQIGIKQEPVQTANRPATESHDAFSDDGLSLSQAQREIQAAEQMELMYAFMKAEEESFTQEQVPSVADNAKNNNVKVEIDGKVESKVTGVNQGQVVKKEHLGETDDATTRHVTKSPPGVDKGDLLLDDSMIKEDLNLIANIEASHVHNRSDQPKVINTSAISSQVSQLDASLKQGFMNSQNTVSSQLNGVERVGGLCKNAENLTDVRGSEVVSEDAMHVLAELQSIEQQHQRTSDQKHEDLNLVYHRKGETQEVQKQIPAMTAVGAKPGRTGAEIVEKPEFVGFQTGSGKRVNVSAEALQKAKLMFAHADAEVSDATDGYQLANSTETNLSGQSHHQASHVTRSGSLPQDQVDQLCDDISESMPSTSNSSVGFCTAGGTSVQVSKTSLQAAKHLLNKEVTNNLRSTIRGEDDQAVPSVVGFQTASGRKVHISDDSLQKAKDLLHEDDSSAIELIRHKTDGFSGFHTASGHKVAVSEGALRKAHQLLTDDVASVTEPSGSTGVEHADASLSSTSSNQGFTGFHTASGNKVHISDEALQSAHQFLMSDPDDKCDDSAGGTALPHNKDFGGFQTASGNRVTVSKESLKRARNLLSETGESEVTSNLPSIKRTVGFQTASGNIVNISDDALKKAQQFLNKDSEDTGQPPSNPSANAQFCGFTTASGSRVEVSEESLRIAKGKMLISDEPAQDGNRSYRNEADSRFMGFTTASGSKVQVSEDSLKIAKALMSDEPDQNGRDSNRGVRQGASSERVVGFTTASGNKVEVSEESLKTVKNIISAEVQQDNGAPHRQSSGFAGFTTASGNKVEVSEESLKMAKNIISPDVQQDNGAPHIQSSGFVVSTTASGNKVEVSEESLKMAKNIISAEVQQDNGASHRVVPPRSSGFVGFTTASGNKVEVSEKSLKIAKNLISDEAQPVEISQRHKAQIPARPSSSFVGFTTASGSKVEVSEESLKIAKNIIADEAQPEEISQRHKAPIPARTSSSFVGFTTASGSKVEVSEESLKLAKNLIADEQNEAGRGSYGIVPQRSAHTLTGSEHRQTTHSKSQDRAVGMKSTMDVAPNPINHTVNRGDCVVPPKFGMEGVGRSSSRVQSMGPTTKSVAPTIGNDDQARKQFVPFKRQHPVSTSPAVQLADRPSSIKGHNSKTFKPYCTTPITNSNLSKVPSNLGQSLMSKISRHTPGRVQAEQIQVVPQQTLPPNHWGPKATPFYRKANFQPAVEQRNRVGTAAQKSFQKFAPSGNTPNNSAGGSSSTHSSNTSVEIGLDMRELWQQAREKQRLGIESKKAQHIKPHPGSLFSKRQQMPRVKLYDVVDGQPPQAYSQQQLFSHGVLPSTLQICAAKAESFKFKGAEHFSHVAMATQDGILVGDGGRLVLDDAGMAGKEEFYNALLDTDGVDPKFVSEDWVYNHYKWIVWKLAAMEVSYPQQFAARLLTPHWVMLQLKYRYDREIDNSQRSALKKILERDDTSSRRLVLCVSAIHKTVPETTGGIPVESKEKEDTANKKEKQMPTSQTTLELTDGWYCIKTTIDKALLMLVQKGKIFVGQKLCIYGADLVGSDDACSPLEIPANLMLRINGNSTRPARYDAKLGLQCNPQPFPLTMSSLYGDGGVAGCLDVVVVRCYPIQYMEKHGEGGATFRNSRAEEKEARKYSREKQQRMEKLFSKIQKDFEKKQAKKEPKRKTRSRSSQRMKENEICELSTGQEIYDALNEAYDPSTIEMHLSEKQMTLMQNYQRSLQEKEQADLQAEFRKALEEQEEESKERIVTPLLRVRLSDYHTSRNSDPSQTCMLTVWRPTEDIIAYLTEGKRLKLYNVNVSPGRFSQNIKSVQLASTKRTRYKELPAESSKLDEVYQQRCPVPMWHLRQNSYEALYGEVDVVGLVTSISGGGLARNSCGSNMQTIYVADSDANVITIKFWGGLQAYSVEEIIKPGTFICCSNLQYKARDRYNATSYLQATDVSSFTQTPKSEIMRQALTALKHGIKNPKEFISNIESRSTMYSTSMTPQTMKTPSAQPKFVSPLVSSTSRSRTTSTHCPDAPAERTPRHRKDVSGAGDAPVTSGRCDNMPSHTGATPTGTESKQVSSSTVGPIEATPTVKRFVPFTGVKNSLASNNSKIFTPATLPKATSGYKYSGNQVATNSSTSSVGSTSRKCFTPALRSGNVYMGATPIGVNNSGAGRLANQPRSNLFGKIDTPERNILMTGELDRSNLDISGCGDSQSSQLEEKRKDIDRRSRLLSRIPSPPPLSPLPSAVRRGFRLPNRRRRASAATLPNLSNNDGIDKRSENVTHGYMKANVKDSDGEVVIAPKESRQEGDAVCDKNRRLSMDGLTASQREVQDLMGMSLSCLQELDMEWSQQTPVKEKGHTTSDQKLVLHDGDLENPNNAIQSETSLCAKQDATDSPPMDLSYPENDDVQQEERTEMGIILHPLESAINHTSRKTVGRETDDISNNNDKELLVTSQDSMSEMSKSASPSEECTSKLPKSHKDRTPKKKQAPTASGRPRVAKRPAKDSPSNQDKPKQSKRFCTRADYAVIDFESLDGGEGMSNRRVTRSSKRLKKS